MLDLLLEVGIRKISQLKDVDVIFKRLKAVKKNLVKRQQVLRELEVKLEKLFGIPVLIDFHIFGMFSENFAVLPYIKSNKDVEIKETKDMIQFINVKKINLIFGNGFINKHTSRELTAILLHEIGHLTNYLTKASQLFLMILSPIFAVLQGLRMIPIISSVVFPLYILCSRSLFFIQHVGEYQADKFVAKMGYGDELISAIQKWQKESTKIKKSLTLMQRISMIGQFLKGSTHPTDIHRIEKLIEGIKTEYLKQYKNKKIFKLLDQYKV